MQYAAVKLPHHNRYPYSAIPSRKTYVWPGGKRLAVNISNNIEIFAFRAGLGSDSATGTAPQNQRNYAWRDYGNRVGLWNYLDLLDEYSVPGSHNVNSMVSRNARRWSSASMRVATSGSDMGARTPSGRMSCGKLMRAC